MIVLYGHRLSQPSRAVEILLIELNVPYRFHEVAFAEGETREEWFLRLNPSHTIPTIVDEEETEEEGELEAEGEGRKKGLVLYESHAIMRYLCRKFGREEGKDQWYPPESLKKDRHRLALIDQHLDWHPSHIRNYDMFHCIMSIHLIPLPMLKREHAQDILLPLQTSLLSSLIFLESLLEARYPSSSSSSPPSPLYLCGGSHPSIADLSTSCELLQIQSVGFSFSPRFPLVSRWLEGIASRSSSLQVSQQLLTLGKEIHNSSANWLNLSFFSSIPSLPTSRL